MTYNMTQSLRNLMLASVAGFSLIACGGGSTSSPGSAGSVVVNPTPTTPTTPTGADLDLVPNDNCPSGTILETITNTTGTVEACTITGTITENLTLTAGIGYALEGPVFVGEDGGANVALTIPAGTTVFGKAGQDYLVITRGSRLNANGTATSPVIMTSIQDVQGTVNPDTDRGQWGGLVINGFAPINDCIDATATGGTAACEKSGEGSSGLFGGDNPNDNSGTLQYMQVKYAGNLINDEDELNGIAFQGVGAGTNCDHIQVHNNADDGVEFFGGTVQCNYLVLTGIGDDSLDWTDGWTGGAQYVLVRQGEDAGDRGIEGDNRSSNNDLTPRSNPTIANFTFLGGASADSGIVVRAGTDAKIVNGVITGFQDAGVDIDGGATPRTSGFTFGSLFLDNDDNIENFDTFNDAGDRETTDTEAFFGTQPNIVEGNSSLNNEFFPGAAELAVPAFDLSSDMGFDNVDYIGAFSDTETVDSNWASGWTFGITESPTECPAGTLSTGDVVDGKAICSLSGTITENTRLNNNFTYQLEGAVFIGEDVGGDASAPNATAASAILTIDAGTTIFGASGEDYLVIARGSQIRSNGTASAPVNMTSRDEVFGTANLATDRAKWGGLVINGRAPINDCIDATVNTATNPEDCEKSGEGSSGLFGGNAADDNSGNLFYTRVSFAGNLINDEDELNGIAFQGVGNGTQVDFIQVHNNADDGVEFFGGTVNVKHVVLTGNGDDSMDWTDGWTGNAQFVLIDQADDAGDRGIEGDNRSSNNNLEPRSNPTVSNFTFIGGAAGDTGIVVRAGTDGQIINGVITGFQDAGIDIDGGASPRTEGLTFSSLFLDNADNIENFDTFNDEGDRETLDTEAFFATQENIVEGMNSLTSDYVPGDAENGVTVTDPTAIDPFFDSVDYIGAVEDASDNWYEGWTILVDQ